jgi:hypothetical protein
MNPKLKHLEAIVAKARDAEADPGFQGVEGALVVRVDCAASTLIGPMADLSIEDRPAQVACQSQLKLPVNRDRKHERTRRMESPAQAAGPTNGVTWLRREY